MRLELIDGGGAIEEPSEAQIIDALEQVYAEAITAAILIADPAGEQFIQAPMGGGHIEYTPGKDDPIYAVDDISLENAIRLFLSYARNDGEWEQAVEWKVYLAKQRPPLINLKKVGNLGLMILLGVILAIGSCGGIVLYHRAFGEIRNAILEALGMLGFGLLCGLMVLYLRLHLKGERHELKAAGMRVLIVALAYLAAGTMWIAEQYYLLSLLTPFVWVTGIGLLAYTIWALRSARGE